MSKIKTSHKLVSLQGNMIPRPSPTRIIVAAGEKRQLKTMCIQGVPRVMSDICTGDRERQYKSKFFYTHLHFSAFLSVI